jgi:uncharacterized membrane protein
MKPITCIALFVVAAAMTLINVDAAPQYTPNVYNIVSTNNSYDANSNDSYSEDDTESDNASGNGGAGGASGSGGNGNNDNNG